jgi:hypothetical protein
MASEFLQFKQEYNRVRDSLGLKIDALSSLSSDKQALQSREIDNLLKELESTVDQIRQSRIMWEGSDLQESAKFLTQSDEEVRRLKSRYQTECSRASLFAGSTTLEGGSRSQREGLLDQRREIDVSSQYVASIRQSAFDTDGTAQSILGNLGTQKEVEIGLSGKMDDLSGEVTTGDKIMSRIEYRERMKTIVIWIVVGLAIIGLGVFLYFVFK